MKKDEYFMDLALKLALKAKGKTSPNPLVGAVIVKNNRIIGEGFHRRAGEPHAEIIALRKAGESSRGSTLFVTLEPCSHFGRTPPCVVEIIKSKIKKVVIGMQDPNPINNGKSIQILRSQKIEVKVGCLEEKLRRINEDFTKYITQKIPFVTVKVAQSLDGKIAVASGESKWITSEKSRSISHDLRKYYDAILVGINTVLKDDPLLDCPDREKKLYKVKVDSDLRIPLKSKIFSDASHGKIIIATTKDFTKESKYDILAKKEVIFIKTPKKDGKVDLRYLLNQLARLEIMNVLVEGGGKVIGSMFDEGLVDKLMFFIALKIIGGNNSITSVSGKGVRFINEAIPINDIQIKNIDGDILVEGYVHRDNRKSRQC
ncbi:MAG: bifunctional diaminohydroxyphosphoribosylaminopyrimidine deaminase/5-amino-6-(5-phosphoribosylamino)uracil reductase RibD [Candidatus Omnitrophica bacterium]|nr:bifunctional diaminohydroxyphosphoribosylaminopyrimidine deaminase/5-amino-6-(5-phosphoribosylamino)uracil reductase RibD [Candidatus Omnitrophota bacterium]